MQKNNRCCGSTESMNIAFSTGVDYQAMYISMYSILTNKSDESQISFHILCDDYFSETEENCVRQMCRHFFTRVFFYRVGGYFKNTTTHIPWINTPTYFRLLLPMLLISEDKCLYLDSDTIALEDLKNLYYTDVSDYFVAGVYAPGYHKTKSRIPDIKTMDNYINAGVLLMNLRNMRECNFTEKAKELVKNNYPSQDQDIINILCYIF